MVASNTIPQIFKWATESLNEVAGLIRNNSVTNRNQC